MIWFTADPHWGHTNILKYCGRPFKDTYTMNRELTERWNARVQPNDLVIIVGDLSTPRPGDPGIYLQQLNGNILLVKGNHDKRKMLKFMPMWVERMEMRIGHYNCLINHRPLYPKTMRGHNDPFGDHDSNIQNPEKYNFVICGHVHEKWLWAGNSLNVGVDMHNFAPLSYDEVLEMLHQRQKEFSNSRQNVRMKI